MAGERKDYLQWDEYFMSLVAMASLRSIYSNGGACLVDSRKRVLSIGSNQAPYSLSDKISSGIGDYLLSPISNTLFTFKGTRKEFEGGTIYVSDFPTIEDARNLAQARLQKLVYLIDKPESVERDLSKKILNHAGIQIARYHPTMESQEYSEFLIDLQTLMRKYIKKSEGPISAEEYYMGVAVLSALRSKDPSTQVGACLVDENGRIISVGYNGTPYGFEDAEMPWHSNGEKNNDLTKMKNPYVVHAEFNTLDNYRGQQDDLSRMKLYLTLSPCNVCTGRLSIISLEEIVWLRTYSKIGSKDYNKWFCKTNTDYHVYDPKMDWSKESYQEYFNETTRVIKKHIGKIGSKM